MLTQDRLKQLLSYDPSTGDFLWKEMLSRRKSRGSKQPYLQIHVDGVSYLAHRLAWLYVHGSFPSQFIDHADGDTRNNRIENLRLASHTQNLGNQKTNKNNQCGIKGVYRAREKYRARIRKNNQSISVGTFETAEEAGAAYLAAAKTLYGEFARAA